MMSTDNALVLAIVALAGYAAVTDTPDRQVVTITMPVATYVRAIEDARADAAVEAIDAVEIEPCPPPDWRQLFQDRRYSKGPM